MLTQIIVIILLVNCIRLYKAIHVKYTDGLTLVGCAIAAFIFAGRNDGLTLFIFSGVAALLLIIGIARFFQER